MYIGNNQNGFHYHLFELHCLQHEWWEVVIRYSEILIVSTIVQTQTESLLILQWPSVPWYMQRLIIKMSNTIHVNRFSRKLRI